MWADVFSRASWPLWADVALLLFFTLQPLALIGHYTVAKTPGFSEMQQTKRYM